MKTKRSRARISVAVLVIFAIVAVFTVRLIDIQIVQADELNAQSLSKRSQESVVYGRRGDIVDADGAVLASSVDRYDINVSPRIALARQDVNGSASEALAKIAEVTGQDPAVLLAELMADPDADWANISKGVTLEVFQAVKTLDIPWVYYDVRPSRTYPNGAVGGNLTGFLGTDGPGGGLELSEDTCLASTKGTVTYEKAEDGTGLPGSLVTTKAAQDGGTLRLTINRDLQFYVQQRMAQTYADLGAEWTTAVVMRISDGHLMAVADYPSVDPNNVDGVPNTALGSRAFSWAYEPGSTMKALAAASLLDSGVATQTSTVTAPGQLFLSDGGFIKDSFAHDDMPWTLTGAIVNSSNTGMSLFSKLLSAQTRYDYMIKFGLNSETEVGFIGESEGVVHPADEWDERTNFAVQFGQGMSVTSVQLASIYQTLGNGGVRMPVTLVEGCEMPDGTVTDLPPTDGTQVISDAAATQTVEMLEKVVTEGGASRDLTIPGYRVAAKSGTAEVADSSGGYGDSAVISFAGLAPADNPQYAVVVTAGIPNSMYSSGSIATTFHDVMAQTLTTFRVTPSTEAAPDIPLTW